MFIGLAGSAAAGGIAVVMYEWHVSNEADLYSQGYNTIHYYYNTLMVVW